MTVTSRSRVRSGHWLSPNLHVEQLVSEAAPRHGDQGFYRTAECMAAGFLKLGDCAHHQVVRWRIGVVFLQQSSGGSLQSAPAACGSPAGAGCLATWLCCGSPWPAIVRCFPCWLVQLQHYVWLT